MKEQNKTPKKVLVKQRKVINLIKELEQKGIYTSGTSTSDIKKIGTKKYGRGFDEWIVWVFHWKKK